MRTITTLGLILILSGAAFGQTTTTTTTATPVTIYEQSYRVIDQVGNLIVFDSGYTYTPSTAGNRVPPARSPVTQVTIVRPTGAPQTVAYPASFVVLGVGAHGVYAIATTTNNLLIALNPQVTLPAAVTGFTSLALPSSNFDVDMGQPDVLSILAAPVKTTTTTGTGTTTITTTTTTTPRTVTVVKFDGTSFITVSTATLP